MNEITIRIPQSDLDDLHARLDRTRWPASVTDDWSRGTPVAHARELASYWRDGFDWRAQEARLNELAHFTTTIDGQKIHFAHERSSNPDAMPLMLLHGWPSSFVEFLDVIPLLRNDFHLVVPSLPGFAFSSPLASPGWTPKRMAQALTKLMAELGYERYGVQGGDTGAFVAPEMGKLAPDSVIGIHLNAILSFPSGDEPAILSEDEQSRWDALEASNDGYFHIQSKSPATLAFGLSDSPAGQLAWIAESFHRWAGSPIDRDRFLTNVSLYWFTGTAGSAAMVYYEHVNDWSYSERGTVPTGVLLAATNEYAIRPYAERDHNIVHWSQKDVGGHFFALEQPHEFASDINAFFGSGCARAAARPSTPA
ncbi:epoxide hydrolase family protein [Allorhizocola rhizosphaerae]|uniref:epoxide hydrolase family protein n=1 Tax=Allorhizocola rhizosphaerae TaxID=1872709 RepID=UPI000E3BEEE0|nr:epoxide hydrolase family protein [Allorhizocola rhizosphaerae]